MPRRERVMCNEDVLEEPAAVPAHRRRSDEEVQSRAGCRGAHRQANDTDVGNR